MRERVDRGEQRYIMPFKPRAHGSIDSFYSAELGVYRPLLRDELERLALPELSDVLEVMRELRTSRRISCRRIPSCANSSAAARCLTEEEP